MAHPIAILAFVALVGVGHAAGSLVIQASQQDVGCPDAHTALERINYLRTVRRPAQHQGPMAWNDALSAGSQDWAKHLASQGCHLELSDMTHHVAYQGENLHQITDSSGGLTPSCVQAVDDMASDGEMAIIIGGWSYNQTVAGQPSRPSHQITGFFAGHIDQVGCGAAVNATLNCEVVVCRFATAAHNAIGPDATGEREAAGPAVAAAVE